MICIDCETILAKILEFLMYTSRQNYDLIFLIFLTCLAFYHVFKKTKAFRNRPKKRSPFNGVKKADIEPLRPDPETEIEFNPEDYEGPGLARPKESYRMHLPDRIKGDPEFKP